MPSAPLPHLQVNPRELSFAKQIEPWENPFVFFFLNYILFVVCRGYVVPKTTQNEIKKKKSRILLDNQALLSIIILDFPVRGFYYIY